MENEEVLRNEFEEIRKMGKVKFCSKLDEGQIHPDLSMLSEVPPVQVSLGSGQVEFGLVSNSEGHGLRFADTGESHDVGELSHLPTGQHYPHNEELIQEIVNNVEILKQEDLIPEELSYDIIHNKMVVIAPDNGAAHKAKRFRSKIGVHSGVKLAQAKKSRDSETGKITGFEYEPIEDGSDCLIIDDICDGGGTFIGLAKFIKENFNVATVSVFTTHGIYSKGFSVFNGVIDIIQSGRSLVGIVILTESNSTLTDGERL